MAMPSTTGLTRIKRPQPIDLQCEAAHTIHSHPPSLMPALSARLIHLRMSPFTNALNSSGVDGAGSAPCSANRFLRSSETSTLRMSALMRATSAGGVEAGANMPNHPSESYFGSPDSAMVG